MKRKYKYLILVSLLVVVLVAGIIWFYKGENDSSTKINHRETIPASQESDFDQSMNQENASKEINEEDSSEKEKTENDNEATIPWDFVE